jgi:hypothetical protein
VLGSLTVAMKMGIARKLYTCYENRHCEEDLSVAMKMGIAKKLYTCYENRHCEEDLSVAMKMDIARKPNMSIARISLTWALIGSQWALLESLTLAVKIDIARNLLL